MARVITIPNGFYPRPYQLDTMKAFFLDKTRNFIDIEHRRAGKDEKWLNIMIAASQMRVGTYLHTFPVYKTAVAAIWEGIDDYGRPFLDRFPKHLIDKVNHSKTYIKFKNGSIYRLGGADKYDSWMGTNPVFVLFSEYAIQDPQAANFFAPILLNNGGWQAYIYTPRGRNHGYHLYQRNKDNPDWFCQHLTVNDTFRNNGLPVIDAQKIESERRRGISEEIIQQEYFCSFDAAIEGAYFAKSLRRARDEGRICDFQINTDWPVSTYWDLGQHDKTCIWFIQKQGAREEYAAIGYYENFNQPVNHYINKVYEFRDRHGLTFYRHYAPHDVRKTESDNLRIIERYLRGGLRMEVVKRIKSKQDGIEAARSIIHRCRFHETNCERGLAALNSYHGVRDDKKGIFGAPVHDWASDGSDAFMQFAQTHQQLSTSNGRIIYNAVNSSPIL